MYPLIKAAKNTPYTGLGSNLPGKLSLINKEDIKDNNNNNTESRINEKIQSNGKTN